MTTQISTTAITTPLANIAQTVLEAVIALGVSEFCISPSARNAALVYPLVNADHVRIYHWTEERSSAFFALGRIKATGKPVAVVTTSGTAVAELLPSTMEAYYSGLPLILITADRPRHFRGSGAPQTVEQVGIFGPYVHLMLDVQEGEEFYLKQWNGRGPLHINVCLNEPQDALCQSMRLTTNIHKPFIPSPIPFLIDQHYLHFLKNCHHPLIIVSALAQHEQEAVVALLQHIGAPVYLESTSGLREVTSIAHLQITQIHKIWQHAAKHGYHIDGILRIGGVPTARLWRDLEEKNDIIVHSISALPFVGSSVGTLFQTTLAQFVNWATSIPKFYDYQYENWQAADKKAHHELMELLYCEPQAEPSLVWSLSQKLPEKAKIYLGNSLPIREWDFAASLQTRHFQVAANRGVNGIDGQLATFLGYSCSAQSNWAILGDLTLIYDLAAPWITSQLKDCFLQVIVINNGGAAIFKSMFNHPVFQSKHNISFQPLAALWQWQYKKWETIPTHIATATDKATLIEIIPCAEATERFWQKYYLMLDRCLL